VTAEQPDLFKSDEDWKVKRVIRAIKQRQADESRQSPSEREAETTDKPEFREQS
jgi:hypothetical protein